MMAEQLLHTIEEHRQKMIHLATDTSMIDNRVVEASIELDKLIHQYFLLKRKQ